jgi:hypothetical protein
VYVPHGIFSKRNNPRLSDVVQQAGVFPIFFFLIGQRIQNKSGKKEKKKREEESFYL